MAKKRKKKAKTQVVSMPRKSVLVDILMVVFGEWPMAVRSLKAIPEAWGSLEEGYRVILVDNGTPGFRQPKINEKGERVGEEIVPPEQLSAEAKTLLRPGDRWSRLRENKGYPGGYNQAARRGTAPLILILTPDVILEPGAIEVMVREMDNPDVGVVGPLLIFSDDSPHGKPGTVQHAGLEVAITGRVYHPLMGWSPDKDKVQRRCEPIAVTGACIMTRRKHFNRVRGFSEEYGAGTYEDVEYCLTLRRAGLKVIYNPEARGTHFVGGSIKKGAGRGGFNLALNEQLFRGKFARDLQWSDWSRW